MRFTNKGNTFLGNDVWGTPTIFCLFRSVNLPTWVPILWISTSGWRAKSDVGEENLFPPHGYSLPIQRCRHGAGGKIARALLHEEQISPKKGKERKRRKRDIISQCGEGGGGEPSGRRRVDVWKLLHSVQGGSKKNTRRGSLDGAASLYSWFSRIF